MKVVAVSQRVDTFPERSETRDGLDRSLIALLLSAKYLPVPIPSLLYETTIDFKGGNESLMSWLACVKPQAFILSGGNDIGQCLDRDLLESYVLEYAFQNKKPLLGICRGMQMMAVWAGVQLKLAKGHARTRHRIYGEISGEVNSYHNLVLTHCPTGFRILAKSEDGEIEAIRHQSLPLEGWMWHPERERSFVPEDLQRLRNLFN